MKHSLAKTTRLCSAGIAEISVKTLAVLLCIATIACAARAACSVGDTLLNCLLAQWRNQSLTFILAAALKRLQGTGAAAGRKDQAEKKLRLLS